MLRSLRSLYARCARLVSGFLEPSALGLGSLRSPARFARGLRPALGRWNALSRPGPHQEQVLYTCSGTLEQKSENTVLSGILKK